MVQRKKMEADVIAKFMSDGDIVPMRVRIFEDGERYPYTIKTCNQIYRGESYVVSDGIAVTNEYRVFDCTIAVFGVQKGIRLYYNTRKSEWLVMA